MFRWIVAPLAFFVGVAALAVLNPRDVLSVNKEPQPRDKDMSPMGRIAAGIDPAPEVRRSPETPLSISRPSLLGPGGADVLTHSPFATDFQSETTLARNGDWIVVGFNDTRGFAYASPRVSGYAYSHDNGATWTDGGQLPSAGLGDAIYGDPDVKTWTDPNTNTRYFAYSSLYITPGGLSSLCVHISTDGGVTWTNPREVTAATTPTSFADKEFIGFDPDTGRLFTSWTNFPTAGSNTIRTAYSDNFGVTWSAATSFVAAPGQGSLPRAAAGSPNVYLAWTTTGTIRFVRSTDNGVTWDVPADIAIGLSRPMNPYGSDRIHNMPSMDVDPNNGNIYVVYSSRDIPPDFSDVYVLRSTNGGATFSAPLAINSSPGNDRAQFFPWVAADETDGSVSVTWYDQRVGTGTSDLTEQVHTHSTDGGVTWSCPAALTDRPFHAESGNTTSQPNLGDYNQCVSRDGNLYSVFGKTDFPSVTTHSPDTYFDMSTGTGAGPAPLGLAGHTINDAGCTTNGFPEQNETIAMTVTVRNIAGCGGVAGITGTLSSTTPGVTVTSAVSSIGDLPSIGSMSTNAVPFEFTIGPGVPCGTRINLVLSCAAAGFADVALDFDGSVIVGHPVVTVLLDEDFDGVVAPALPAGWSSALLQGASNPWITSMTFAASGTNSVFCADLNTTSHNELQSPVIAVPAGTDVVRVDLDETHNNELAFERRAYDGAVMRILVGGTKYFSGGAGIMSPFYAWQLERASSSESPLQDLSCWSGITTPTFARYATDFRDLAGQNFQLLFGMSTDLAFGTATGQFIDNIVVTAIDYQCECNATAAGPGPLAFDRVTVVPNPFNPETTIRFALPSKTTVTAEVWSVNGARVRTLARDQAFGAGAAELRWNGLDDHGVAVASGIYFVRVKTPIGERIARAVLLK